ncbi:hypothetical protein LEP1GSC172_0807 [Leptospira noguchii]|uniref:Uncharacterized protein n=2 Tax=Leptospira noguchii TaxID=28182 RepID=T0FBY7_9LEPT|nr:hypothetical protein LEP1GSC172_0807 [Leptospira noguchii]EQA70658.1 hypothetical protein LEP1GSC059_4521 [Leptospira noguchii serovar Panama str. CZ214]
MFFGFDKCFKNLSGNLKEIILNLLTNYSNSYRLGLFVTV